MKNKQRVQKNLRNDEKSFKIDKPVCFFILRLVLFVILSFYHRCYHPRGYEIVLSSL